MTDVLEPPPFPYAGRGWCARWRSTHEGWSGRPRAVAERGVATDVPRPLRPGRHRLRRRPPANRGGGRRPGSGGGGHGVGGAAVEEGRWFDGTEGAVRPLPVPLVVRRHLVPQAAYQLSQEYLPPEEVRVPTGCPSPAPGEIGVLRGALRPRSGRGRGRDRHGGVLRPGLARGAGAVRRPPGWRRPASGRPGKALALADENSWSPQETVMRLAWWAVGARVPAAVQRARSSTAPAGTWGRRT